MKKKIICAAICVLMLMSMLPVFSYAKTIVDTVSITDVEVPYAGHYPDYELTISAGAEQTSHYDENNIYCGVYWVDVTESNNMTAMRPGIDTFREGRIYRVAIILKSSDGYSFANASGKSTVHAKLNGDYAECENMDRFGSAENVIVVRYNFKVSTKAIEQANITVDEVGYNKYIDFSASTRDTGYTITKTTWYEDGNEVTNPSAQFRSGKNYKLHVRIVAKNGYSFVNAEDDWKNPAITASVNGDYANTCIEFAGNEDPHKALEITYEFGKVNNYNITHVSVRNIVAPQAERTPEYTASADGTGYTVSNVVWRTSDGSVMDQNDVFVGGEIYSVWVTLAPKNQYTLSITHGTVNGKAATVSGTTLKYTFEACPGAVNFVGVEIEEPAVGIKCPYGALLMGNGFGLASGDNPSYASGGVQWYNLSKDWIYIRPHTTEAVFKSGNTYRVRIAVQANDGFSFAPDMKATVNGKSAKVEHLYPDLINIYFEFTPFLQDSSENFNDVNDKDWFKPYVDFSVSNGIFSGKGEGKFAPSANITRAEFVQVLANITGVDLTSYKTKANFTDVKSSDWYAGAVNWGFENGIVSGKGEGKFDPNAKISREEMCVMLVNYAKFKGITFRQVEAKETFADDSKISGWAKDYVYKCQMADLVNGKGGGIFDPKGSALRCEASAIFTNFYKAYMN